MVSEGTERGDKALGEGAVPRIMDSTVRTLDDTLAELGARVGGQGGAAEEGALSAVAVHGTRCRAASPAHVGAVGAKADATAVGNSGVGVLVEKVAKEAEEPVQEK